MNKPYEVCTCMAYRFPHRKDGGKCNATEERQLRQQAMEDRNMSTSERQGWIRAQRANVD